jgi:hypothetical protein
VLLPKTAAEVPGHVAGFRHDQGVCPDGWSYGLVHEAGKWSTGTTVVMTFAVATIPGLMGGVLPVAPVGRNSVLPDCISTEQRFESGCGLRHGLLRHGQGTGFHTGAGLRRPLRVYALHEARTDQFAGIGKVFGNKPGFCLRAGPDWNGEAPAGITAITAKRAMRKRGAASRGKKGKRKLMMRSSCITRNLNGQIGD